MSLAQLDASQPLLEIVAVRDPVTLEVSGFAEAPRASAESAATSSSLTRRLASKTDFTFGSSSGLPFLPGGLDNAAPPPHSTPAAAAQARHPLDLSSMLLSTPPGFEAGVSFPPTVLEPAAVFGEHTAVDPDTSATDVAATATGGAASALSMQTLVAGGGIDLSEVKTDSSSSTAAVSSDEVSCAGIYTQYSHMLTHTYSYHSILLTLSEARGSRHCS